MWEPALGRERLTCLVLRVGMAAVDDTTEQTMSADLTTLRPLAGDRVGGQKRKSRECQELQKEKEKNQ